MKISLCMIVKDETNVLRRCLDSVKPLLDEIIIIHTHDSKETKQIASQFTEKTYDFKWIDDFSVARNFAFSKASMDYIMWLDADDVIEAKELEKLLSFKSNSDNNADIYMLRYDVAFDEHNNPTFSYYRERIIKNDKTFFWQDPVHEVIVPHGKIEHLDIAVSHKKEGAGDSKRNLRIYEGLIEKKHPLTPRQKFYYARELMYNGLYEKAIHSFNEFLEDNNGWIENKIEACKNLALCYSKLNNSGLALKSLVSSFSYGIPRAEILCEIGSTFVSEQKYEEAIYYYTLASESKINIKSGAFIIKDYYDFIPYLQLCYCYFKINKLNKAKYYNNKAALLKPNDKSVLYNINYFNSLKKQKKKG